MIGGIISGGQTGADRAALDWALNNDIPHHGWCPRGRRAEDGPLDDCYRLEETAESGYIVRTELNVRDSDGTVVFTLSERVTGGSLATLRFARRYGKPYIHLARAHGEGAAKRLTDFIEQNDITLLNVAGPRASSERHIGQFVDKVLTQAFGRTCANCEK